MDEMSCYTIYDEKACEFCPLFFCLNDNIAKRTTMESAKGNGNMLFHYPEDFKLYRIGVFNKMLGTVRGDEMPIFIISVKDLVINASRRSVNAENS